MAYQAIFVAPIPMLHCRYSIAKRHRKVNSIQGRKSALNIENFNVQKLRALIVSDKGSVMRSGQGESDPWLDLGKVAYYHYTMPAFKCDRSISRIRPESTGGRAVVGDTVA